MPNTVDLVVENNSEVVLVDLIPLDQSSFKDIHYGPTESSNWILPERVLMSAYPGDLDDEKSKTKIEQLLKAGINCFVCLQ